MLRGGAYKPRTSPYSFQGLGREGLRLLAEAREPSGAISPYAQPELIAAVKDFIRGA